MKSTVLARINEAGDHTLAIRDGHWTRTLVRGCWRLWRALAWRDHDRLRITRAGDLALVVLPGVFDGVRLRTGVLLASQVDRDTCPPGSRVLDLGTGSGVVAVVAARAGARVVATDINPEAVRCARVNALALHLEQCIETREGDLFAPVSGERFDLICFNPPYYRGHPRDSADAAWRSRDVFDRFLRELPLHLTSSGRALVVLSSDGEIAPALASAGHLRVRPVRERRLLNEILTVYDVRVDG